MKLLIVRTLNNAFYEVHEGEVVELDDARTVELLEGGYAVPAPVLEETAVAPKPRRKAARTSAKEG